jgi:hypothetical protein
MADSERSQQIEQLQEQVNRRVREAVAGLQRELRERLRRAGDRIVGEMDRELEQGAPELPASFLSGDELAPLAAEAGSAARREAVTALVSSFGALDRAGSQSEILATLLREAGRFAGRSALFLARGDGLELWGAEGWEASLEGTRLDYADSGPWAQAAIGSGAGELTTGDCGRLCSQVDAPLPQAGVLLPLVLRDRVAAVVYADRGEGEELLVEALQALTYTAALALETLPFRERAATPTLVRRSEDGDGGGAAAGLDVWGTAAVPAPSAAAEPAYAEPPADEEETLDEAGFAAGAGAESEAEGDEVAAADAGFALSDEAAGGDAFTAGEDEEEEEEDLYTGELEIELDEEGEDTEQLDAGDLETGDLGDGLAGDDFAGGDGEETDAGWGGEPAGWEEEPVELPDGEPVERDEPPSEPVERAAWGTEEAAPEPAAEPDEPAAGFESPMGVEPPLSVPPPAAAEIEETAVAEDETADLGPSAAAPPPSPPSAGGSEVAPPSDVQGPGRAFAGAEPRSDDEARHEEARRLARLLVSEIRLYNEEEVDEGRRNNDVYARLKEDIDRSRQMYEERVDPRIRDSTDYFYQELVRNLGGGDERALGL